MATEDGRLIYKWAMDGPHVESQLEWPNRKLPLESNIQL